MRSPRTLRSNLAGVEAGCCCFFRRPRILAEIISSKLKVKYSCLNAYLSKSNFARRSEEKTNLLTEEVGDLWDSQLGSILCELFSAGVEFTDIETLPTFAMRQFLPFTQVDSMKKTQSDIVDTDNISIDVI